LKTQLEHLKVKGGRKDEGSRVGDRGRFKDRRIRDGK